MNNVNIAKELRDLIKEQLSEYKDDQRKDILGWLFAFIEKEHDSIVIKEK